MVRKLTLFIIALVLSPVLVLALQDSTPPTTLDITGVNPNDLPTVEVAVNVLDSFGQPVPGLTPADFNVTGDIADITQIIQVENITDDDLPVSVVLTVDTSESMAGQPLDRAREAATVFVQQLRPQDSVAVVAFGSSARLVQDYTTDKAATLDALNNLQASGRTALYDGGVLSVQQAAAAPHSRRIVIFLSDGAEFEAGRSNASREDALSLAQTEGVPVYTIGLGFGTDRTYLQGLAENTNARFFESPTADDLTTIYTNIFDLIRTQYIVTLNVDAPADGTVYNFGLVAPTLDGSPQDTAELFTPVPVPIVRLSDVPAGEITSPVTLQADVLADDPLTQVRIQYDDREPININTDDLTRFEIPIGPNAFTPGDHTLQVQATDSDGDTGEAEITFQVGALPPTLSLDTRIDDGNLTVFMNTGDSQTPVTEAFVTIDGDDRRDMLPEEFGMFNALFPLIDFSAGEHTIGVTATSENGESTTETLTLDFPQVPPQITLSLEPGTSLAGDIEVTYDISAQTDETTVSYQLNDNGYLPAEDSILINAAALGAGVHQLAVTVTDGNGQLTENVVSFTVSEDAIPTNTPTPAPSDTPTPTPSDTPTPAPSDTPTPAPTNTAAPSDTPTPAPSDTPDQTATVAAQSTVTAVAIAASIEETNTAQSTANAQATTNAQATADAMATADLLTATAGADATANAQATDNAQATIDADATATEQAATQDAVANATATEQTLADLQAEATGTASLQQTLSAEAATINAEETAGPTLTPTGGPRDTASATPVGTPEVIDGGADTGSQIPPIVYALCGVGLLGVILVALVLGIGRRQRAGTDDS